MRLIRFAAWLACLLLLPMSATGVQAPQPDAADVVNLRFDWPAETAIGVSFASRQVREQPGGSSDMRAQGHYQMYVSMHPQGLLVTQSAPETTLFESVPEMPPPVESIYRNLSALSPNYVVSAGGELIGIQGLDELTTAARRSVESLLVAVPAEGARVEALVDEMLSEPVLRAEIQEQWNSLVGTWVGADFELGVEYVLEEAVPSPMFPDVAIPMRYVFEARERLPCPGRAREDGCVRLHMESAPDADQFAELVQQLVARIGGDAGVAAVAVGQLSRVDTIELVAEPDTLLPHELSMSTELGAQLGGTPDSGPRFRRYRETRYRFDY